MTLGTTDEINKKKKNLKKKSRDEFLDVDYQLGQRFPTHGPRPSCGPPAL